MRHRDRSTLRSDSQRTLYRRPVQWRLAYLAGGFPWSERDVCCCTTLVTTRCTSLWITSTLASNCTVRQMVARIGKSVLFRCIRSSRKRTIGNRPSRVRWAHVEISPRCQRFGNSHRVETTSLECCGQALFQADYFDRPTVGRCGIWSDRCGTEKSVGGGLAAVRIHQGFTRLLSIQPTASILLWQSYCGSLLWRSMGQRRWWVDLAVWRRWHASGICSAARG
jgi:hypothetical protein